jgi:hypothetical protein
MIASVHLTVVLLYSSEGKNLEDTFTCGMDDMGRNASAPPERRASASTTDFMKIR